jgi:phosphatidylserine/phosphatidylglycerophosphate/cardiolipin synthase-like enzyme
VNPARAAVAEEIRRVAAEFPLALLEGLARAIDTLDPHRPGLAPTAVHAAVPQAHYRALAYELVEAWQDHAPDLQPQSLAFALLAAGRCEEFARTNRQLELVWTGPEVEAIPPRRTEQALLEVINSARSTLTIVSFVAYKVPYVCGAIAGAARRGVSVRLILEDPEVSQGKVAFAALTSLGPDVAAHSQVYVWPLEKRTRGADGRHGSLHAKCAVADRTYLLLSSANLTEHALTLNLELGLLLTGGSLPSRVDAFFDFLIHSGTLVPVRA